METSPSTGTIRRSSYKNKHLRRCNPKATCGNSWLVVATWATFGQPVVAP